jgi:DNA-directed RNA polymerase specialized sigma24 family protein
MPGFADDLGKLTPHLRRFARALVRGHSASAADDLVQETIVLASRADLPKRGPTLAVWCFAALVRLNRMRNRAPIAPAGVEGGGAPLPFLPKDILRLDALPLEFREVLLLTALAGLAYGQAADVLDVDVSIVFSRLTRARDLLMKSDQAAGGRDARTGERIRGGGSAHLRLVK